MEEVLELIQLLLVLEHLDKVMMEVLVHLVQRQDMVVAVEEQVLLDKLLLVVQIVVATVVMVV